MSDFQVKSLATLRQEKLFRAKEDNAPASKAAPRGLGTRRLQVRREVLYSSTSPSLLPATAAECTQNESTASFRISTENVATKTQAGGESAVSSTKVMRQTTSTFTPNSLSSSKSASVRLQRPGKSVGASTSSASLAHPSKSSPITVSSSSSSGTVGQRQTSLVRVTSPTLSNAAPNKPIALTKPRLASPPLTQTSGGHTTRPARIRIASPPAPAMKLTRTLVNTSSSPASPPLVMLVQSPPSSSVRPLPVRASAPKVNSQASKPVTSTTVPAVKSPPPSCEAASSGGTATKGRVNLRRSTNVSASSSPSPASASMVAAHSSVQTPNSVNDCIVIGSSSPDNSPELVATKRPHHEDGHVDTKKPRRLKLSGRVANAPSAESNTTDSSTPLGMSNDSSTQHTSKDDCIQNEAGEISTTRTSTSGPTPSGSPNKVHADSDGQNAMEEPLPLSMEGSSSAASSTYQAGIEEEHGDFDMGGGDEEGVFVSVHIDSGDEINDLVNGTDGSIVSPSPRSVTAQARTHSREGSRKDRSNDNSRSRSSTSHRSRSPHECDDRDPHRSARRESRRQRHGDHGRCGSSNVVSGGSTNNSSSSNSNGSSYRPSNQRHLPQQASRNASNPVNSSTSRPSKVPSRDTVLPASDNTRKSHERSQPRMDRKRSGDVAHSGHQARSKNASQPTAAEMNALAQQWLKRRDLCQYHINEKRGCRVASCTNDHVRPRIMPDYVEYYCKEEMWKRHMGRKESWPNFKLSLPRALDVGNPAISHRLGVASDLLRRNIDAGWQVYVDLLRDHPRCVLPASCCESVLGICKQVGSRAPYTVALAAFRHMEQVGCSRRDYALLFDILAAADAIDESFNEFERMKKVYPPSSEIISHMLAICKNVDPARGFTLLNDIQQHGLFNTRMLEKLMALFQADKKLAGHMPGVFQLAKREKVTVSESAYLTVLSAMVAAKDFSQAFKFLTDFNLNKLTPSLLVELCRCGTDDPMYLQSSLGVLSQHSEAAQSRLPAEIWNGLMTVCLQEKEIKDACHLYRGAMSCDIPVSTEVTSLFMKSAPGNGDIDGMSEIVDSLAREQRHRQQQEEQDKKKKKLRRSSGDDRRSGTAAHNRDSGDVESTAAETSRARRPSPAGTIAVAAGEEAAALVSSASPDWQQPSPSSMQSLCQGLKDTCSWASLYKVTMTMLAMNMMPETDVLALLLRELGQADDFANLHDLVLQCIKMDVDVPSGFYQQAMQVLSNWDRNPSASDEITTALNAREGKSAVNGSSGTSLELNTRQTPGNSQHTNNGSLQSSTHTVAANVGSESEERSLFIFQQLKLHGKNSDWPSMAKQFMEMQQVVDVCMDHVTMVRRSDWLLCGLKTSAIRCGCAFREFLAAIYQLVSDTPSSDSSGTESRAAVARSDVVSAIPTLSDTDQALLAHVGISLIVQLAQEEDWSEAYLVLFSLHIHQIQYLNEEYLEQASLAYPPATLTRSHVALLCVQVCLEMGELVSAMRVLQASDWAVCSSADAVLIRLVSQQRTALLERLLAAFLEQSDFVLAFTIIQQLPLRDTSAVEGAGNDGSKSANTSAVANACARTVHLACCGEPPSSSLAIQVFEYMAQRSLIAEPSLARRMYARLLCTVVGMQRLTLARQMFLAALREHFYECPRVVSPLHLLTLKAHELEAAELYLLIEHYLYELAESLQAKHQGNSPWSFAIRPVLEHQPVMLMVQCNQSIAQHDPERCDHAVEVVRTVLAEYLPPALTAQLSPQLENGCHCLRLDPGPLVRWFTTNSNNPYNIKQLFGSPTSYSAAAVATDSTTGSDPKREHSASSRSRKNLSPGHWSSSGDRKPQASPLSPSSLSGRYASSEGSLSLPAAVELSEEERKPASTAAGGGDGVASSTNQAIPTVKDGESFPDLRMLRSHIARRVCRRLTKHMRNDVFAEGEFKSIAQARTHSLLSQLQDKGLIGTLVNDSRLESRIRRHVDSGFPSLTKKHKA
ncbi:uncharacterized protein LOC135815672 isoform X2 [Sycon ciliatum]|uniref:uncharacterized protein LOC135815672 isoform X2 n=1 Tax=Sycon ciliatum TaxID=27933 RepID=UPI0031F66B01